MKYFLSPESEGIEVGWRALACSTHLLLCSRCSAQPPPDSILVNDHFSLGWNHTYPEFDTTPDAQVRLRFVNTAALSMFNISCACVPC